MGQDLGRAAGADARDVPRALPFRKRRGSAAEGARAHHGGGGAAHQVPDLRRHRPAGSPGAGVACRETRALGRRSRGADDRRGRRAQRQQPALSLPEPHGGLARRAIRITKTIGGVPMKLLTALLALAMATAAHAQSFPENRTVRFISGVTPGAASDTMARILAEKLQPKWGSAVLVDNRLCA